MYNAYLFKINKITDKVLNKWKSNPAVKNNEYNILWIDVFYFL